MKMSFGVEFVRKNGIVGYYERKMDIFNPSINMNGARGAISADPSRQASLHASQKKDEEEEKRIQALMEEKDDKIDNLKEEIKDWNSKYRKLKIDEMDVKKNLEIIEKKNLELIEDLESARAEALNLRTALKQAGSNKMGVLLTENEQLREEMKRKVREERKLAKEAKKANNEKIVLLNKRIQGLEEEIEKRREKENELEEVIEELKKKVEEKEKEIQDNANRIEDKYTHFDELNKYIGDILAEKRNISAVLDEKLKKIAKLEYEKEEKDKEKEIELANLDEEWRKKMSRVADDTRIPLDSEIQKKNDKIDSLALQLKLTEKLIGTGEVDLYKKLGFQLLESLDNLEVHMKSKNFEFLEIDIIGKKDSLRKGKKGDLLNLVVEFGETMDKRVKMLVGKE